MKLEDFKNKYAALQHEMDMKANIISELEASVAKEKQNNIKLLRELKRAHGTVEEMKKFMEKEIQASKKARLLDEERFQEVFQRQEQ